VTDRAAAFVTAEKAVTRSWLDIRCESSVHRRADSMPPGHGQVVLASPRGRGAGRYVRFVESRRRRIAVAKDDQAPPVRRARSPGTGRLTSSVEIVRVRGPDATHLAEIQLEAVKEVLTWALSQHDTSTHHEDRAA
jgi:hypothetical protein